MKDNVVSTTHNGGVSTQYEKVLVRDEYHPIHRLYSSLSGLQVGVGHRRVHLPVLLPLKKNMDLEKKIKVVVVTARCVVQSSAERPENVLRSLFALRFSMQVIFLP